MSAPVIFIGIPILLGGVLWIFARRVTLTSLLASSFSLVFALLAGLLPINQAFMLGSTRVDIPAEMNILGRQLVLDQKSLPAVILLFALGAFWFLGIRPARAPRRMAPLGMILLGLAVATLAVRPFLFSAIIFEGLVLVSIPLLVPAGRTPGRGVVRYIIFMTLAMPFILLSGALAGRLELDPSGSNLILYAVLLLGFGFAIWLAVFPLNTWVPMLAEDTPPFVTGFLLSLQSTIALLMLVNFIGEFSWLSNYPAFPILLRTAGLVTVASAGIWAAFQTNLNRLLGYLIVAENGLALMMLSLPSAESTPLFAASLLPRLMGIAVLSLSLAALRKAGVDLTIKGMEGAIFRNPSLVLALFCGYFSLAGLPLLASFPVHLVLFEHLADVTLESMVWIGIGVAGFLLIGLRLIFSAIRSETPKWVVEDDRLLAAMLIFGVLLLLVMGLFPSFSLDWISTRL
jgi:NADH-quinone oxidoreductase subunit N